MATSLGTLKIILGADTKQATSAIEDFKNITVASINTMAQRIRTFGYLASVVLTAPVVSSGKQMMKAAGDFDFSMQKIVGLTGVAQNEANEWAQEVKEIAKLYGRLPQELAEALYFIASSGIQGAKAMKVLRASAKGAASGLGETQEIADLVTSALNAYAGTGLDATQVMNQLVTAVKVGKAEADSFAKAVGQIIPLASEMNVSFAELVGGMAAITLTGASAANAAVYLKGVLNALITASEQGEKALRNVGSSYSDLRRVLQEEGLIALMQKIRDLTVDNAEALSDIFPNVRGLLAFLSIAGKNFEYNKKIMDEVMNSTKSANEAWEVLSSTIRTRFNKSVAEVKTVMIELGSYIAEALLPILEDLAKQLSKVAEWFSSLSEAKKEFYLKLVGIATIAGPLALYVSTLLYSLTGLWGVLKKLSGLLSGIWNILGLLGSRLRVIVLAFTAVTGVISLFKKLGDSTDKTYKEVNKTLEKTNEILKRIKEEDVGIQSAEALEKSLDELFAERSKLERKLSEFRRELDNYRRMAGLTMEEVAEGKSWGKWEKAAKKRMLEIDYYKEKLKDINELINIISEQLAEKLPKGIERGVKRSTPSLIELKKMYESLTKAELIYEPGSLIREWFLEGKERFRKEQEAEMIAKFGAIPRLHLEGYYRNVELATDIFEKQMERQRQIASELTYIFQDLFMTIGEGWQAMINQIIQSIKRLAAEVMARLVVFTLLKVIPNLIAPGTGMLAGVTLEEFVFRSLGRGITRHARGNFVVPPGFPNDTYPAMLSSGEAVLTPMQLRYLTGVASTEGKVEFVIEGETLRGVLQKTNTKRNIY